MARGTGSVQQAPTRNSKGASVALNYQYDGLALTAEQRAAVHDQVEGSGTGGVWHVLNAHLRSSLGHPEWLSDDAQRRIGLIDSALRPLAKPLTVYRRVRNADVNAMLACADQPGSFIEPAYLSTSVDPAYPASAGPDYALLEIDVPAGIPALWIPALGGHHSPTEQELLLGRGLRLHVLSDETAADGRRQLLLGVEPAGPRAMLHQPDTYVRVDGRHLGHRRHRRWRGLVAEPGPGTSPSP